MLFISKEKQQEIRSNELRIIAQRETLRFIHQSLEFDFEHGTVFKQQHSIFGKKFKVHFDSVLETDIENSKLYKLEERSDFFILFDGSIWKLYFFDFQDYNEVKILIDRFLFTKL